MTKYKCISCEKIVKLEYVKKKIRCPYCGSKVLYKPRTTTTVVKAE